MRVLQVHTKENSITCVYEYVDYFDVIYLTGIYPVTNYSYIHNAKYNLRGSLFSIDSYDIVISEFVFVDMVKILCKKSNKKVIVDFIPNHIGRNENNYKYGFSDKRWGNWEWIDTIQLDYTKEETLEFMKSNIIKLAKEFDGFRFDMAHLVLRKNYEQKHNVKLNYEPLEVLVKEAKKVNPNLLFIAETYQDYEELKNLGFMVYRIEPRRNQVVTIDCAKDVVIVDNHDERLLYWECNKNLKCLSDKLKELSLYQNTLWYLPAIKGFLERPSATYYFKHFKRDNNIEKIYYNILKERR